MLYHRRRLLVVLLKISDILILITAFLILLGFVGFDRKHMTLGELLASRVKVIDFIVFLTMLLSWHLVFNAFQLYRSRRLENRIQEFKDILKATTVGAAVTSLLSSVLFSVTVSSLVSFAVLWLSSTILTISFRSLLRYGLGKVRLTGRNLRSILILGTNQRAYDLAHKMEKRKELGCHLLGYVDDEVYWPREGVQLLGTLADFSTVIRDNVVDGVVVALPIKSYYDEIRRIAQEAEEQGVTIHYFCCPFNAKNGHNKPQIYDDFRAFTMAFLRQETWQHLAKRAIDLTLTAVLVVATLPLMVLVAMLVKLTSRGPIFFAQDRVGYQKRVFRMYKFRTMVVNAEKLQLDLEALNEMDGPVFKIRKDPRITKVGGWLRKTSLDELPQFFNVLKGDMSLVGPRPLPVRDYSGFYENWQRRRFSVLPGLTCTWQISGRNNSSFEEWMKLDIEYVDTWKLSNDLKILLKTLPAVIRMSGAV